MSCTNTPMASREAAVSGPFGNRWAEINEYHKMLHNKDQKTLRNTFQLLRNI